MSREFFAKNLIVFLTLEKKSTQSNIEAENHCQGERMCDFEARKERMSCIHIERSRTEDGEPQTLPEGQC